jgi:tRNA-Thr(GGU) m(6)t(6)A37 methyltransferase TsaA
MGEDSQIMREGERRLPLDPALQAPAAGLVFIGSISSPWTSRADCPKNMAQARERGRPAQARVDVPYRAALVGLEAFSHVILLTWLHEARRDLAIQKPRHAPAPRGTFALRSPVRPNPIGLHVVRLLRVDEDEGLLGLEAIDVLDGTPLLDIKPFYDSPDRAES